MNNCDSSLVRTGELTHLETFVCDILIVETLRASITANNIEMAIVMLVQQAAWLHLRRWRSHQVDPFELPVVVDTWMSIHQLKINLVPLNFRYCMEINLLNLPKSLNLRMS